VAHNVFLEHVKKHNDPPPPPQPDPPEEKERYSNCLDSCIGKLNVEARDLIREYYRDERRAKIDHRKSLADRLGITLNTLRMRAHRIKKELEKCLRACVQPQE
jgi:DNA-directed RNA polymerase specialized sigma24 family protein